MMVVPRLFVIADTIADEHLPKRLFRPNVRLVEKIKLRTAIYNALLNEARDVR